MFELIRKSIFYLFINGTSGSLESRFQNPLVAEFLLWIPILLLAVLLWIWSPRWLDRAGDIFKRFAQHKIASAVSVGLLALSLRALLLLWVPIPSPINYDEFSYLLQAQTFSSGRLANPPHPMWVHFETFNVNMQPTYHSMYPPGQAIFLTVGEKFFGHPWFGVWLSMALMCAAVCWMLQGWMPPPWALLGGLLTVLRFALFGDWINSYFGGAVAGLGGALVLGALARIRSGRKVVAMSVVFAIGLVILANTRPYEGLAFSIVPLVYLLVWLVRNRGNHAHILRKVVAVFLLVGVPSAGAMMYYNRRCTGHALTMPYVINQDTYHVTRPFLWQTRYQIPDYHHQEMRRGYVLWEYPDYLNLHSSISEGLQDILGLKFRTYYNFYLWPFFLAVFPATWIAAKSKRLRPLVLTGGVLLVALLLQLWRPLGHYAAPGTCVVMALLVTSIRLARTIRWGKFQIGVALSRAIMICMFAILGYSIIYTAINPFDLLRTESPRSDLVRASLATNLDRMPGKHLVFVHSAERGNPRIDWVYNEPDIDHAKIVWARDMGSVMNQELVRYFPDRDALIVNKDDAVPRLAPYKNDGERPITLASGKIGLKRADEK
jgi:hypothetical protein